MSYYNLVICSILNIAFDLVFVLAFHMGVGGTAIASLLAQGIAGILCFFYAVKKYSYFTSNKETGVFSNIRIGFVTTNAKIETIMVLNILIIVPFLIADAVPSSSFAP